MLKTVLSIMLPTKTGYYRSAQKGISATESGWSNAIQGIMQVTKVGLQRDCSMLATTTNLAHLESWSDKMVTVKIKLCC